MIFSIWFFFILRLLEILNTERERERKCFWPITWVWLFGRSSALLLSPTWWCTLFPSPCSRPALQGWLHATKNMAHTAKSLECSSTAVSTCSSQWSPGRYLWPWGPPGRRCRSSALPSPHLSAGEKQGNNACLKQVNEEDQCPWGACRSSVGGGFRYRQRARTLPTALSILLLDN